MSEINIILVLFANNIREQYSSSLVGLTMNLRERSLAVFKAGYQFGQNSFRTLALKTNLSKSSVHRLYHRIVKRNQHPESSLWETKEGQEWPFAPPRCGRAWAGRQDAMWGTW